MLPALTYEYWTVGLRPIILKLKGNTLLESLKYDWNSGRFVSGWEYYLEIYMSTRGDMDQLSEEQFIIHVETLRSKLIFFGELEGLYTAARKILRTVNGDVGLLKAEQKKALLVIQRQSYLSFQSIRSSSESCNNQSQFYVNLNTE